VATVLEPYQTTARYPPHIAVRKPRENCELESVEPSNALWWADPAELVGCRQREYASKPASTSGFGPWSLSSKIDDHAVSEFLQASYMEKAA